MFLANLIFLLHILIFLFVVLVPFIGPPLLILLNLIFMIGILFHWMLGSDVCALTVLESYLRGEPMTETFFGRLFGPMYRIDFKTSKVLLLLLILLSIKKLLVHYNRYVFDTRSGKQVGYEKHSEHQE